MGRGFFMDGFGSCMFSRVCVLAAFNRVVIFWLFFGWSTSNGNYS